MGREQLGEVGVQGAAGLACPRCGSTQFTAKRSKKGKVIGVTTLGVGVLLAPKSQVKCVACGNMYKRGGRSDTIGHPPQAPTVVHVPATPQAPTGTPAGWYPDPTGRHGQRWWGGATWMDSVLDGSEQTTDAEGVRLMDAPTPPAASVAEQLRELAELRDSGVLTEEEFAAQKAKVLSQ